MTIALPSITGSVKVVAVGDVGTLTRGKPAEFRHKGLTLVSRTTAMSALLEVGRDPDSIVLVSTALTDMPLVEFVDVLRSVAHVPVVAGIAPGCPPQSVSELFDHGIAGTVALPATPRRLLDAVLAFRAPEPAAPLVLDLGSLSLDDSRHSVTWHGREVALPPKNFDILRHLMLAYPRVVTVRELMEFVGEASNDRAVRARVAVGRLRASFVESVAEVCAPIETVHRVGYRLRP